MNSARVSLRPATRRAALAGAGCAVLMALAAWISPGVARAEMHPNSRTGWLIGFSLGGGSAELDLGGIESDREGGASATFRGGYAFSEDLSLELHSTAWAKEEDDVTLSLGASTLALNWYPGHSGFALRAGIGSGIARMSTDFGSVTVSETETGLGFVLGAAYEFRVMRTFALGPQVDFGFASLDSIDANWATVGLGFNWYFTSR